MQSEWRKPAGFAFVIDDRRPPCRHRFSLQEESEIAQFVSGVSARAYGPFFRSRLRLIRSNVGNFGLSDIFHRLNDLLDALEDDFLLPGIRLGIRLN